MLAYKVFQSAHISASDKPTREPASAGCQIGQQRPKHEGVKDERRGSCDPNLPNNLFFEVRITL